MLKIFNVKKSLIILSLFLFTLSGYTSDKIKNTFNPNRSIVQIYTTSQRPDYDLPWQMKAPGSSSGSGCIIAGQRILTNAHVVSESTFVQVRKVGGVDKYTAEVEYIGHDSDLAILKVKDKSFFNNTSPIELGQLPQLRDEITVYGFPKGGSKLFVTNGTVSRIENGYYLHGAKDVLRIQIDAVIDSGSSGGPILFKDKIVGLTFQGDKNINSGIPVTVINQFLKDIKDGKCNGLPSLGVNTQPLENPDIRSFLKMKEDMTGLLINRVEFNSTSWDHLKQGDVLLTINDKRIANDGTISFRGNDRLSYLTELQKFQIGDSLNITLLRDGYIKKIKLFLKRKLYLVPWVQYDKKPTYFAFAGFVFTTLNFDFILTWGEMKDAPILFKHYFYNGHLSKKRGRSCCHIKDIR